MISHTNSGKRFQLLAAVLITWISAWVAQADVVLDGSMGSSGSLPGPDFSIDAADGTTVGSNLFHSFSEFDLTSAQSATFNGPASISNILGRVTGGSASSIDGQIRSTIPNANLFLANPNGLIFGPNATLDVQGSFYASTSDYIGLADGQRFTATPSAQDALLTTAAPAAFGFLGARPGAITVNDSFLEVPNGKTLALIGGNVSVTGSSDGFSGSLYSGTPSDPVILNAPGGRLDLVGVASAGEVPLAPDNPGTDGFSAYGNIEIRDTVVAVSADTSGAIYIRGGEIVIDSASVLSHTVNGDGGDITIKGNNVVLHNDAVKTEGGQPKPRVQTGSSGNGRGGDIRVDAQSLTVDGDIEAVSTTLGTGQGGDMLLNIGSLGIHRTAYLYTETAGAGAGGDLTINADSILITNVPASVPESEGGTEKFTGLGAFIYGDGDGGDVTVNAGSIKLVGPRVEFSIEDEASGDAGDITIQTNSIELLAGGHIINGSFAAGDAGDIIVDADSIVMDWNGIGDADSRASTFIWSVSVGGGGDAGNVEISTGKLDLFGSKISAFAIGNAGAGNVSIIADSILLDGEGNPIPPKDSSCQCQGTYISANAFLDMGGTAGSVDIDTSTLIVRNGATISATTESANPGGSVNIDASSILIETESRIDTRSNGGDGSGGDIVLNADNVTLASGGNIRATSIGAGAAGDITINVTDSFESHDGLITTESVQSDGGNITLNATNLLHLIDSSITTSVQGGTGAGGNISIDPEFVVLNSSQIIANAFGGPGGNITIVAQHFIASPDSVIEASSALNVSGTVRIDSPNIDTTGDINVQPETYLDASSLLPERCAARSNAGRSSFVVGGRGGLPPDPDGYLASYYGTRLPVQQSSPISNEQLASLFKSWQQGTGQALPLPAGNCQS